MIEILTFSGNGVQTVSVPILDDLIVEETENFFAHLTTTQDELVQLLTNYTEVVISDNEGISVVNSYHMSYIVAFAFGERYCTYIGNVVATCMRWCPTSQQRNSSLIFSNIQ